MSTAEAAVHDPSGADGSHPLIDDRHVGEVNRLIDRRQIDTAFSPLVHLATGEVVGYEAYARGPRGSAIESPLTLLAAARQAGRLAELDWLCAASAYAAASAAKLHPSMTIFLNFEPTTLLTRCPADLLELSRRAQDHLRVVVEVKETSLTEDPGHLFDAVTAIRQTDWGIAVDNAVAAPATLALLPLVHPDVLKLDLTNSEGDLDAIATMSESALAYAESSGGKILVERIEDEHDLLTARFAGATYGQGWHFGSPGPILEQKSIPRAVFPLIASKAVLTKASPFEIVMSVCEVAHTEKRFLEPLARHIENQVDAHGPKGLLLISFESDARVGSATISRLAKLADRAAFTGALGVHLGPSSSTVRCAPTYPGEPIGEEWNVIVLGPYYSAALVARATGDEPDGPLRRFDYSVTHNRELVLTAARALLRSLGSPPNDVGSGEHLGGTRSPI